MFDANKLDYFVKDRGLTRDTFIEKWGISLTTYYNKRNNPKCFTLEDMEKIKCVLNLANDEVASIFFR